MQRQRREKFFQVADKLSVFDIDTIEVFIRHGGMLMDKNVIRFLKTFSESVMVLLKEFKNQ